MGVEDRPSDAPQNVPFVSDYKIVASPSPAEALGALSTIVFAYAGTPAFFSIISEMRDPKQYVKSMALCQGIVTAFYITIGIVVYYFCGSYVASPALGSAGTLFKRICYGLALPGLCASLILLSHVSRSTHPTTATKANVKPVDADSRQVRLHPPPQRNKAPQQQHHHSLVNMVRLHLHGRHVRIRPR